MIDITMRENIFVFILAINFIAMLLVPSIGMTCNEGTRLTEKQEIAESLFGLPDDAAKKRTSYDYNGYRCNFPGDPYKGSHAGWDVQTQAKYDSDRDHEFFCITPGIVLADGRNAKGHLGKCANDNRAIVIYNESSGMATHYLHASDIHHSVRVGRYIGFGDRLGNQGRCGVKVKNRNKKENLKKGYHVHIEVRTLELFCRKPIPYRNLTRNQIDELKKSSRGTLDFERRTIDPIPYLYSFVKFGKSRKACLPAAIWANVRIVK